MLMLAAVIRLTRDQAYAALVILGVAIIIKLMFFRKDAQVSGAKILGTLVGGILALAVVGLIIHLFTRPAPESANFSELKRQQVQPPPVTPAAPSASVTPPAPKRDASEDARLASEVAEQRKDADAGRLIQKLDADAEHLRQKLGADAEHLKQRLESSRGVEEAERKWKELLENRAAERANTNNIVSAIKLIMNEGEFIELTNGTVYKVLYSHRVIAKKWISGSEVRVILGIPTKIINGDQAIEAMK